MSSPLLLVTTSHPSLGQHPGPAGETYHPNLGRLIQPRHTSSIEATVAARIPWAADNDCFQGLDRDAYVRMIDRLAELERDPSTGHPVGCKFVTVPDVVADAYATLSLFEAWHRDLLDRDLPLGYVLQDGADNAGVPWSSIEAVFVGGSDEFKLGPLAAELAREAKARGKWVHWGRVNSRKRIRHAAATGAADSLDGSKWARFRTTYLNTGLEWVRATGDELALGV